MKFYFLCLHCYNITLFNHLTIVDNNIAYFCPNCESKTSVMFTDERSVMKARTYHKETQPNGVIDKYGELIRKEKPKLEIVRGKI
jgi:uncharacterized Zn finger protein (UPF0148 family)